MQFTVIRTGGAGGNCLNKYFSKFQANVMECVFGAVLEEKILTEAVSRGLLSNMMIL